MKETEDKRNDDIKVILEGISSNDATIVISDADDAGRLEFHFEEAEKHGLVFEEDSHSGDDAEQKSELQAVNEDSVPEPEILEELPDNQTAMEEELAEKVLPLNEEVEPLEPTENSAEANSDSDELSRAWSTYLPRFTEVSETYRMINDPRPRPEKKERERIVADSLPIDEAEELAESDPTAESVEEQFIPDAVVINVNQKAEEEEEQVFSIYKFSEPASAPEPVEEEHERTVEDEIAEIEELFVKPKETDDLLEKAPDVALSQEDKLKIQDCEEDSTSEKSYNLPDPDDRVHVIDYTSVAAKAASDYADAPGGSDENSGNIEKKGEKSEFTTHSRRDFFKDRFLDSIMSTKIRLVAAIILVIATIVFENIGVFGKGLEDFLRFESFPGAMAIADLQFAACVFILALPEISRAFRALSRATVVPEILPVVSLILISVYTIVIATIAPHTYYPLFGGLSAIHSLFVIVSSCFKRSADFLAFKRVATNEAKTVLDLRMTRLLERENLALDGAVDETKSKTVRLFKSAFVTDFFKRTSGTVEDPRTVVICLSVSFISAVVGLIIAYFVGNGWLDAVTVFTAVSLLTLPAVSVLVHKLVFYHSSLECESEECAIIGERSLYEYSGADVIAFDDTDIFGSEDVHLKRIIHYGDVDNVMKAMRQMSALFANFGGPLSIIFDNSLDRKSDPAKNPEIEPDGIAGTVDGKVVRAGSAEYMKRHGIDIPDSAASAYAGVSDSTKVMYGAEDGRIYVQFHIRYSFSEEFTKILPSLKKEKIVPLIYTRDPNVSADLIGVLTNGEDCIRVLKKNTLKPTEDKVYKRVNAGVVTSGDIMDAMNIALLAKKYVRLIKKLSVIEFIAMGAGCILSAALAISGHLGISSVIFLAWHCAWFLLLYTISAQTFTVKKKEEDHDDR